MGTAIYSILGAVAGMLLTLSIFLANVIFRTGHVSARVEELERWRINMRADMHEISDKIEGMGSSLKYLSALIEERTDRRSGFRHNPDDKVPV